MNFSVTILGCGAATPTLLRNSTAQLINTHDKLFLIDCGEGTQLQLRKHKVRFQRINHIFISHLHGDHYLGLMGLMSSMHLLGRKSKLHLYGPPALKDILEVNMKHSGTSMSFPLEFHPTQFGEKQTMYEDATLSIASFPLQHRIPCTGFLITEKLRDRKIIKDFITEHDISLREILKLKKGEDVTRENGEVLLTDAVTILPQEPKSYAFCSDTKFDLSLKKYINGVTMLYHEATFADDMKERAEYTFHSTARQAAKVALEVGAEKLVLGHFSSRYPKTEGLLEEAREVFANTVAAWDGLVLNVPQRVKVEK